MTERIKWKWRKIKTEEWHDFECNGYRIEPFFPTCSWADRPKPAGWCVFHPCGLISDHRTLSGAKEWAVKCASARIDEMIGGTND